MKYARDQKTGDMGFAGMNNTAVKAGSTKYAHNQWSGHSNDGREVNMGRGPTKGNDGKCGHSGFSHSGKMPPTSALPSLPAQNSVRDMINRGSQVRGGGQAMPTCGRETFNMGRGPTRGNSQ
jgi:hypothetical protein